MIVITQTIHPYSGKNSRNDAIAWINGKSCRHCTKATGAGGKVTIGWGEYFHSVVDYKRDPTQGAGCSSCLFGGTSNNNSLPQLEVVRFFGSRDSVSMGFSGGWEHNYGIFLQVNSRKSAPSVITNGGNSVLVIQPGKRKGQDIGFYDNNKDGIDWALSELGSTNAGLFQVTTTAGANTWVNEIDLLITYTRLPDNDFPNDLVTNVYAWSETNSDKPTYFLIQYLGANYLQILPWGAVVNEAKLVNGRQVMKDIVRHVDPSISFPGNARTIEEAIYSPPFHKLEAAVFYQATPAVRGLQIDGIKLPVSGANPIPVKDINNNLISYTAPVAWVNVANLLPVKNFYADKIGTKFTVLDYENNRTWKFEVLADGMPTGLSDTWFNGHAMLTWQGDRSNNGITLNYAINSGKAFLQTASDDYGHQLTYHWFAHPWGYDFIDKITLPSGDEIKYEYRNNGVYAGAEINDDEYRLVDDEGDRGGVFFDYDGSGILRKVIYSDGNESFYGRNRDDKGLFLIFQDATGNPTSRKDRVWLDEYLGRAYQIKDAENRVTFLREDNDTNPDARIRTLTVADGSKVSLTWTGWPAVISNEQDGSGSVLFASTFDNKRRVLTRTDSEGNVTSFTYNREFFSLYRTVALNGVIHGWHTYTAEGKLATEKLADGSLTVLTWNANGKLLKGEFYAPEDVLGEAPKAGAVPLTKEEWIYDGKGRLVTHIDKGSRSTKFTYNDTQYGDLETIINPDDDTDELNNPTIRFTYNARGLKSSVIDPEGRTTRFEYNNAGRLTSSIYH